MTAMSLFVAQDRVEFGGRLAAAFRQKASSALCPLPSALPSHPALQRSAV